MELIIETTIKHKSWFTKSWYTNIKVLVKVYLLIFCIYSR